MSAKLHSPTACTHRFSIDEFGGAISYRVRKAHEADAVFCPDPNQFLWEEIPAHDEFSRPRFILAFERERPDQHRGLSMLAAVMSEFKTASEYKNAELQAVLANALRPLPSRRWTCRR